LSRTCCRFAFLECWYFRPPLEAAELAAIFIANMLFCQFINDSVTCRFSKPKPGPKPCPKPRP
jgi:hypothetical protein